jgi:hypothetical protein
MCAPKEPSRRARSDSCSVRTLIRRLQYWNDEVSDVKTGEIYVYRKGSITSNISTERAFRRGRTLGLAAPSHTVPYGTVLSRYASQALRARLRSYCPSGTKYILRAEALIKLVHAIERCFSCVRGGLFPASVNFRLIIRLSVSPSLMRK